ncbi:MAG: DUF433 domain-containing protein [Myxococcales bacterium]|nr:DUF433 domain-containing protein [Myxococcales bacterium]
MTLRGLEPELATLKPSEKAEVVRRFALEIAHCWPGIERTSGVVGGDACIVPTRIPVWALDNYRRLAWSQARILENYPGLRAADPVNAWAYADAHRDEIDVAIRENETA